MIKDKKDLAILTASMSIMVPIFVFLVIFLAIPLGLVNLANVEFFRGVFLGSKWFALVACVYCLVVAPRSRYNWLLVGILSSFMLITTVYGENHGPVSINERVLNVSNQREIATYLAMEDGEYKEVDTEGNKILVRDDGKGLYLDYGVGTYPGKYVMLKNSSDVVLGRVHTSELDTYKVLINSIELSVDIDYYPLLVVEESSIEAAEKLVAERGKTYEPLGKEISNDYWSRSYLNLPLSVLLLNRITE